MVPARGSISWRTMVRNQFTAVPTAFLDEFDRYVLHRRKLMEQIEKSDIEQLQHKRSSPSQGDK